jgi:hypothetical protein
MASTRLLKGKNMEKNNIFDMNVKFGKYDHFSQIALSDEETMQLYRITFGMDADRYVDLNAITTEEFCDMEQTLAQRLLEAFENNDAMLDPIYELLGEAA